MTITDPATTQAWLDPTRQALFLRVLPNAAAGAGPQLPVVTTDHVEVAIVHDRP